MSRLERIYFWVWGAIFILLIIASLVLLVPQYRKYIAYQNRISILNERIKKEEELINKLKYQQELFQKSPRFVEQLAHEIGMAKSNEVIFTFIN